MKVLIIIPYFGKWPEWIDYFLESCRYNPEINWLLLSDSSKPTNLPSNVNYYSSTLQEFNELASKRLNMDIKIIYPYKLCDFKPAYGVIFNEYIKDYDFWGYSDIDLVFGKIKNFITESILRKYELITVRNEFLAGHFTLYKNNTYTNTLFKTSNYYKAIFEDFKNHYAFDERTNFFGSNLKVKTLPTGLKEIIIVGEKIYNKTRYKINPLITTKLNDMTKISFHEKKAGKLKFYHKTHVLSNLWFKQKGITNWEIKWENGILTDTFNNQELLHFHIIGLKNKKDFIIYPFKSRNKIKITPQILLNY